MAAGTSIAEANLIHDFEASRYWSNRWWETQTPEYDSIGYWFKPGYWEWVPDASGWYSVDSLNSRFSDDGGWLDSAFYVQVVDHTGATLEGDWNQISVQVTAGTTYYVVITCRYSNTARYSARVSEVAEYTEWLDAPPSTVDDSVGLRSQNFISKYTISRAFGGLTPGDTADAYPCAWNWGRKGQFGSQYWSPTGAVSDGDVGWFGAPGTCMTYSSFPVMGRNFGDPTSKWRVTADAIDIGGHENLSAEVWGVMHLLDLADVDARSNYDLTPALPTGATGLEFETGTGSDPAEVIGAAVTMDDPYTGAASKVLVTYPSWPTSPAGWGAIADAPFGDIIPDVAGAPGGPESAGAWSSYVADTTIDLDLAAIAGSTADSVAAGMVDPSGLALFVIPEQALSSSLPGSVTPGVSPQDVSVGTPNSMRLDVTYQSARYRYVVPVPPDLSPPPSSAPPCQLYPRDDDQGVGSAAIWPPPSSGRPGSYY